MGMCICFLLTPLTELCLFFTCRGNPPSFRCGCSVCCLFHRPFLCLYLEHHVKWQPLTLMSGYSTKTVFPLCFIMFSAELFFWCVTCSLKRKVESPQLLLVSSLTVNQYWKNDLWLLHYKSPINICTASLCRSFWELICIQLCLKQSTNGAKGDKQEYQMLAHPPC